MTEQAIPATSDQPTPNPDEIAGAPPTKADGVGNAAEREAFDPFPVPPIGLQSSKAKKVITAHRKIKGQPRPVIDPSYRPLNRTKLRKSAHTSIVLRTASRLEAVPSRLAKARLLAHTGAIG